MQGGGQFRLKKIIVAFALCFLSAFVFASDDKWENDRWENNLSFGISFPQAIEKSVSGSVESDLTLNSFDFNAKNIIAHRSGFTVFTDIELGGAITDDLFPERDSGFHFAASAGVGYSFVNTKKFILSLGGIVGFDMLEFSNSYTMAIPDSKPLDMDISVSVFLGHFGADLYASYRISSRVGVYLDLKGYYNIGTATTTAKTSVGSVSVKNVAVADVSGFVITPALGLSLRL